MAYPMTLPMIAVLSLAGAGLGIHLGHSAVAEIDPVYFSTPESKFYADLTPHRNRNWSAEQPQAMAASASAQSLHGCVGCRTYPEEYYPVHEASLTKASLGWAESADAEAEEAPQVEVMTPEPTRFASVERYTDYPMTAEEAAPASEPVSEAGAETPEPALD